MLGPAATGRKAAVPASSSGNARHAPAKRSLAARGAAALPPNVKLGRNVRQDAHRPSKCEQQRNVKQARSLRSIKFLRSTVLAKRREKQKKKAK